jgi:hypothetical protein
MSVKLAYTISNNFYLRAFFISSKTGPRFTDENGYFFYFLTFEENSSCDSHTLCIKELFSAELDNVLENNFILRAFYIK